LSPAGPTAPRGDRPHHRGARAAHALRFELGLDAAPIGDLWSVIAKRGVHCAFRDLGAGGGDGVYLWTGESALIVVNSAMPPLRQRFTAAHELGHHEMHRPRNRQLLLADKDVEHEATAREREANAFAANLLAPDRALREELGQRPPDSIQPVDVVRLARTYGLSYSALLNRLSDCGCIRVRDRERLQQAVETSEVRALMKAMGFDARAAFPSGPSLPEAFVLAVVRLYHDRVLDADRLAELLRLSKSDAEALAGDLPADTQPAPDEELDKLLGY
jgi:Zn-dependent peptidase ImmA (M78 family)